MFSPQKTFNFFKRILFSNIFFTDIKRILVIFLVFIIPLIFTNGAKNNSFVRNTYLAPIPVAEAAGEISIAYMGDARPSKFGSAGITELTKDFNQVVAQSPTGKVGAVFLIGDFDKISQTQQAYNASTLKTAGIPIFYVMGNHEVDDDNPDLLRQFFPYSGSGITLIPGPIGTESTTYSADIGNMHIVNLNVYWDGGTGSSSYTQRDGDVVTALRNWLSANLAASSSACKVVLAHEPLYPKNRHTGDSLNKYASNRDALQALFVAQKVGVFVGAHTHYAVVNDYGGVWHSDAGVSGQKTEDGEDPFASIFYTHVNSAGQMILTWKKGSGSTWSTGGTYTAQCGGGGPDTESPTVAITCPTSGQIYNSIPSISISGTVSEAASSVEVKTGTGTVWHAATLSADKLSWSFSGFTASDIILNANTIYVRATDLAGNVSVDPQASIQINFSPTAVIKPALGNMQVKSMSTQDKPQILYDTFTDTNTLNSFVSQRKATSPGEQAILQSYVAPTSFNWNPSFISDRFSIARANASKTDYLVFLMEEEMAQPNYGWYYGVRPGFPGDSAVHTVDSVIGATANWGASSSEFYLQLLTAWKQLCTSTGKKCALLIDAQDDPAVFFPNALGNAGVNYVAANYDMIYAYSYPNNAGEASCGAGFPCGKKKVDYWRGKGFNGKINYILDLESPMDAGGYNIVKEDFKSAADAGANIISAYPNWSMSDKNNTEATARMIQIWNEYGGYSGAPACIIGPGPGPCTPSCPGGCADVGQSDGCSGTCPNSQGAFCTDNNSCTIGDICSGGSCQPGVSKTCTPPNSCVSASCNSSGDCEFTNLTGSCDDGNGCTLSDTCSGGLCRGTPKDCSDGEACTIDFCTEGTCKNTDVCGGLVPCGRLVDNPDTDEIDEKAPCNLCTTIYMIKEIINFLVTLAFALAVLALVIAGITYTTSVGDKHKIERAKKTVQYALIGLFIVFLAWLAIAAILQAFGYANIATWNQVNCTIVEQTYQPPVCNNNGTQDNGEIGVDCGGGNCPACAGTPFVCNNNGTQDNGETGIDCGGGNCPACGTVPTNCPIFPVYGPTPGSFSALCTYTLTTDGSKVYAKNNSNGYTEYNGTLNQVLINTAKSGNHVCIQEGNYTLNSIALPEKVFIECLPGAGNVKPHIQILPTVNYLIYLKSDSSIKGCTFEFVNGTGTTIYANGDVKNWSVENNHFINTHDAVLVKNDNASNPPTNGYGLVLNNTGLHSKLGSLQGSRYVTFKDNKFYDRSGDEFFDFNGKNGAYDGNNSPNFENTLENNILENVSSGYSFNDEAVDMIGNNNNNVVRNNRIIGNFQKGIGPRYEASGNCIEGNYIEFKSGTNGSAHGITLWDHTSNASRFPANNKILNNTIVGNIVGISLKGAKNNIVTGNSINATQCGISVSSDSTGNTVSGNIFLNPAIPQTCN